MIVTLICGTNVNGFIFPDIVVHGFDLQSGVLMFLPVSSLYSKRFINTRHSLIPFGNQCSARSIGYPIRNTVLRKAGRLQYRNLRNLGAVILKLVCTTPLSEIRNLAWVSTLFLITLLTCEYNYRKVGGVP